MFFQSTIMRVRESEGSRLTLLSHFSLRKGNGLDHDMQQFSSSLQHVRHSVQRRSINCAIRNICDENDSRRLNGSFGVGTTEKYGSILYLLLMMFLFLYFINRCCVQQTPGDPTTTLTPNPESSPSHQPQPPSLVTKKTISVEEFYTLPQIKYQPIHRDHKDVSNKDTIASIRITESTSSTDLETNSGEQQNITLTDMDSCSICIEEFQLNETIIVLPRCLHRYHLECIKEWLTKSSDLCPSCKEGIFLDCQNYGT